MVVNLEPEQETTEVIRDAELDQILELQIKIARAGEQHRLSWWKIDATDRAGGGDFFHRFSED